MKRSLIYTIAVALAALGVIVAITDGKSDEPIVTRAPALPELAIPATIPKPTPASSATEKPASPPPAIAEIETKMRKTPVDRPMDEVGKSWFGCVSDSSYNDTLALLNQKSPAVAGRFKGEKAECSALKAGLRVKVLSLNEADNVAQISVDETREVLWTDSSALKGHEPPK